MSALCSTHLQLARFDHVATLDDDLSRVPLPSAIYVARLAFVNQLSLQCSDGPGKNGLSRLSMRRHIPRYTLRTFVLRRLGLTACALKHPPSNSPTIATFHLSWT